MSPCRKSPKSLSVSNDHILQISESQRKAAFDKAMLARKMRAEAIRIRQELHRSA